MSCNQFNIDHLVTTPTCQACGHPIEDGIMTWVGMEGPFHAWCAASAPTNPDFRRGWICPKCGSGMNPDVSQCPCNNYIPGVYGNIT